METSFLAVTASQTFPWTGKRELRAETANLGARAAEADLRRTLLTITADTERAYLDFLLVRDQLSLLAKRDGRCGRNRRAWPARATRPARDHNPTTCAPNWSASACASRAGRWRQRSAVGLPSSTDCVATR